MPVLGYTRRPGGILKPTPFWLVLSDAAAAIQHHAVFYARDPLERQRLEALADTIKAETRIQKQPAIEPAVKPTLAELRA